MSPERWLAWADRAYFGTAIIAAIFTGFTIAAGIFQNRLNARISDQKDRDLAAFKADAASKISAANSEIAGLVAQSDQLKNDNLRLSIRLAELTAPRSINTDAVTQAARAFPGTKFDVSVFAPDPEAEGLATSVETALTRAGWVALNWASGSVAITRPNKSTWGVNTGVGAGVLVDSPQSNPPAAAVAAVIRQTLTLPGFAFTSSYGAPITLGNRGALHFVIGKKPVKPE